MHGNSHKNQDPHHLYEIYDKEEEGGLSRRIRRQLRILNLAAGWLRYFARILRTGIPGRLRAEEIEDEYIKAFETEKGRMPRGNLRKNRKD